ncbi:PREDICTED: cholesterol 25-hydroxylase [Gekko japonicus]|uniref:Cholesterol 25-hydroxylase n=1 Tax=Gekko japonicus TaxID=146911 RepID=A0ABM1L2B7_GEKJA|nr:PREDICTED: cholesterol 25-hydroxylase [Gekko japonicus]
MNWTAQSWGGALREAGLAERPGGALLLQALWDSVRAREGWLRSPFFPVLFSFAAYMGCCSPFVALDCLHGRLPALQKYKIQPQASPSAGQMLACTARSLYDHLVGVFPVTVAHWYWRPLSLPERAPELPRLLRDLVACLLLFDLLYFLWHLLHHRVPWLYRTFHKVHHKHVSTFALSTQYSSRWELLWLGLFAALVPLLLRCHPMTEMAFFLANIWLAVEDHSGYDLPWSTHRLVPFGLYGGAVHHDLHHLKFKFNYAPYFTHWDRLFGTLGQAVGENPDPAKTTID